MKGFRLCLLGIIPLLLCGCVPHVELSEKAIVEALAIDLEGEEYHVTVQYFGTEGSGGTTPVDSSKPNAITAHGRGETVTEAMNNASINCGSPLMLGANQFVLIGREATKINLSDLLGFILSYNQCHPQITIAAADEKASDILSVHFKESVSSPMKLAAVFRNSINQGAMFDSAFISAINSIYGRSGSAVLPLVKVAEGLVDTSEDGKSVTVEGAVLYRDGAALADISAAAVSGLMLLDEEINQLPIKTKIGEKNVSLNVYDVSTSITSSVGENNRLVFVVETDAAAQITENMISGTTHETYPVIEEYAAETLSQMMKTAAEEVIMLYGADPIGLESIVRNSSNELWLDIRGEWQEALEKSEWRIFSEVRIERYGTYME